MQLVISVVPHHEPDPDLPGADPTPAGDGQQWDVVMEVHKKTTLGALAATAAGTADGPDTPLLSPPQTLPFDEPLPDLSPGDRETTHVTPYLDGVAVPPSATVEEVGLVSGDRLGLNGPTAPTDLAWRPAHPGRDWLEVHAVSGPDAGRVWPVRFGSYGMGAAPGSWIRLIGDELPELGPELTIDRDGRAWLAGLGGVRLTQTGMTLADKTATVEGGRLSLPEPPRDEVGAPDPRYRKVLEDAATEYADMMEGAQGARLWPIDMDLAIGDTLLRLVRRFDPDAALAPSEDEIARDFNRPPRLVPPLQQSPAKMPIPPKRPNRRQFPLLMMLSPMLIGVAFVYLFHSYYFLIITLLTPMMMMANWIQDRRSGAKQYRRDNATYRQRRKEAEHKVFTAINVERVARCQAAPDPAMVGLIVTGPASRLWERRRIDPDFLVMRVGTVDQPSLMELDDPAREEPGRKYRWNVPDLPIGVSVTDRGVIGIAGTPEQTGSITRWMVIQAAALHSPRDVQLYLLLAPTAAPGGLGASPERWAWARWLPQARPHGAGPGAPLVMMGNDPETIANRVNEISQLIKARREARGSRMGAVLFTEPDVLIVMDGARWLRDVPGVMKILVDGPAVRVFTIAVELLERLLPEECTAVVRAEPEGLTLRQAGSPNVIAIRPDDVSLAWCDDIARSLSSLRDVTPDEIAGLPERVRLLELLHTDPPTAQRIATLWGRRPASTTFPLGTGFDGTISFDLVRDGPHGLIAGTTGSGKSELLQSLVASLAAVNRPDELVFVLVDYKGGSAFHSCVHLPHTLGMVTDLDEALSLRALESLAAELRRREQMLADVGAKDMPEYRALRARHPQLAPMPRLLLVIDEFATMARETPSFVPGLVSIAQRGRSLGVHLILATQRPAGAVTADIKANTNLRIALRVTDPLESSDVIDTNDAAHISTRNPGRALVRLGHRSVIPFQTAYVGAPVGRPDEEDAEPEEEVVPPPGAERLTWNGLGRPVPLQQAKEYTESALPGEDAERTDLDDLVTAIREAAELVESVPQLSPWLAALPPMLLLEDLDRMDAEQSVSRLTRDNLTVAPFARADLPAQQTQRTYTFDPSRDGHLFVIGAPRAGRSQVLRTIAGSLARGNSSADVQLYGIDAAGSALNVLTELPHCGGVVPRVDLERLERLIAMLATELERRHQLMAEHNASDLPELRIKMGLDRAPAHVFLFVDGWDAVATVLSDHDGGTVYSQMQEILREGPGAGIHALMTSERVLLGGRVASLSENKLIMRMTDRGEMSLTGLPLNRIPTVIPPGRAWRPKDQVEVQVAMLAVDPSGQGQAAALRAIGQAAAQRDALLADGRRPVPIGAMPSQLAFADTFALWPKSEHRPMAALLGLADGGTTPLTLDFAGRAHSFSVAGPPGSGRSNVLTTLGISLLATGTRLVVLTPRESPLRRLANHQSVTVINGPHPDPEEVRALVAPGCPPTVLLVDDVDLFGPGNPVDPALRAVAAVGRDRGVGIAFAGSADAIAGTGAGWIGEAKRSRQGVLLAPQTSLEGDLLGTRLTHSQLRVPVRPGRGYTTTGAPAGKVQVIAIPLTMLK